MKIKIVIATCCLLITSCIAHAMIQEIPKQSFEKIESYVTPKKDSHVKNELSHSFSFNVAMLPAELRYRIVVNMFDGNKELANVYYKTPLLYVCKKYHQAHSTALQSFLSKEETKQLTIELFMLPAEPTKIIFYTLNPSFMTRLIYDGPIISETALAQLQKYKNTTNKIFKNRNILEVNGLVGKSPFLFYIMQLSILITITTLFVFPVSFFLLSICEFSGYCPETLDYTLFTLKLIATASTFHAIQIPKMMKSASERITL